MKYLFNYSRLVQACVKLILIFQNQNLLIELMKNHEATLNEEMKSTIGGRVIKLFKNITHHEHQESENLSVGNFKQFQFCCCLCLHTYN
jgi:uncharacterized protein YbcI